MEAGGDFNRSRDLYVAFAFAAADLLVEVDESGVVLFAVGAAMGLVERPARQLAGMNLAQLFVPEDAERVDRALKRMDRGERVRHLLLHSMAEGGTQRKPVAMAGYRHPQRPKARLVVLTHAAALDVPSDHHDPSSGLLDTATFADVARRLLHESASGEDAEDIYRLTLVEVPEVERVRREVGPLAADEFVAALGGRLREVSVGGDAAGELGENRYGVIHGPGVGTAAIEGAVSELIQTFVPNDAPKWRTTTLALDNEGISSEEAANALLYTLNRFSQTNGLHLDQLAEHMRPRLSATVDQIRAVKSLIENGEFELVFQPIVDLWNDVVHHFECLVRFPGSDSPFDTVTFAESVGIVGNLDLAILKRAIEFMRSPVGSHDSLRFAVNLSGRSLSQPETARRLLDVAQSARDLRGRLLFELTESAAVEDLPAVNAVLQELRRWGFRVCLDDFGAGSAAFHYLRALQVDHVKIDGAYVQKVTTDGTAMPFLRAIAQLCNDLKVGAIAEFVENAETANLLKLLKVRYGQGYLYGKPSQPKHDAAQPLRGWAGNGLVWQNGLLVFRPS